ncbi:ribonuclease H-like protein [Auricularia subglabra TFB-10046 SS5]|uniref:ribonuclease H n=1 Tax=Auricularia subglabra (strain TFB-10046 / SS5) TaxID=717982 RepID=J0WPS6_AURST|nr:ribonuclease H-like protein [Auricularia subglabra TFB-10046 SS5]
MTTSNLPASPSVLQLETYIRAGTPRSRSPISQPGTAVSRSNIQAASAASPYPPVPVEEEHLWDILYTTGAFCSNARAGVGVWSVNDEARRVAECCPGYPTQNRADLIAIIRALEATPPGGKPLLIVTESSYAINCIYRWIPNWMRSPKGWTTAIGEPVKNQPVLKYLAALMSLRQLRGKARSNENGADLGIESAFVLARAGALLYQRQDEDWEAKTRDVQSLIDVELLALRDGCQFSRQRKSDVVIPDSLHRPKMDVAPEDEFGDADTDWMCGLSETELAKFDHPLPPPALPAPVTEADVDFDNPFAGLTQAQLDALDRSFAVN